MATHWGAWGSQERSEREPSRSAPAQALPPERVAAFIAWIATAPRELVLDEASVTPLHEHGWP
jgi:NADP-dependent 3-hydroxy acid dehydrogenase YdfG